ncbi:cytochrome P450 [Argonema antarcticum]|uniref:cytochrome P450 n=1 Tax=Argonema antarcticum TaxID=2942763 RepID=UPI0020120EA5|nr:cytochrome P450 [Argonema antarcticum]MCL1472550.1 cytochrome P450 [Argonema antarcticum A004/B2]
MNLPSGPKAPIWLQYLKIATNPIGYMDSVGKRYGDIFTITFGDTPVLFVSNPQGIEQIFSNTKEITAAGELNRDMALITGDRGILQLDGLRHKHRRRLIMPAFHGARLRSYGQRICDLTDKIIGQHPTGKVFVAYPSIEDITLQISIQVVLGLREGERYDRLRQLLPAMLKLMRSNSIQISNIFPFLQRDLGKWSPWGRLLHFRHELYQLLETEIKERRQQAEISSADILSDLMSAKDETGEAIDNEELRDLIISPLLAAQDASAIAIAWALYWIHSLPTVRDRLLAELDNIGKSPDPMSIVGLPYLSAVCNETLRIYPTQLFTFPRIVESPIELMGYQLEPGTLLRVNICSTHQREDLYPQPQKFKPERFLERQFSAYEFLPFGGGARSCLGAALALFEMKLILATMLSRYQLELANRQPERPKFEGLLCYPASGVKMAIKNQRQQQELEQQPVSTSV